MSSKYKIGKRGREEETVRISGQGNRGEGSQGLCDTNRFPA